MSEAAFYLPLDDTAGRRRFESTSHTAGPWDARAQHGGPPAALLAHALDVDHPRPDLRTVRVTVEILRPVPTAVLTVTTRVIRDGKKVQLLGAALLGPDGGEVATATMWRIRTMPLDLGAGIDGTPMPGPDGARPATGFFTDMDTSTGYLGAMETRFVTGDWADFDEPDVIAWLRMRHPLVAGRPTTPTERVLVAADSGNGVSSRYRGMFINPDLSVHLVRPPTGEWVGLQARTTLTDDGIGLAATVIHDRLGPVGRGMQALLLDRLSP